jgi:hypothetical protein
MSIQDVAPEELARLFHHYHHALAQDSQFIPDVNTEAWEQMPAQEKHRLVAAARLALLELSAAAAEHESSKRYFAKPGEAEWGC